MDYDRSFDARARDLCYLGATEKQIADLLGVSVSTLKAWRERYPSFDAAWQDGTMNASVLVVKSLLQRACGYDKIVWKETQFGMMREQKHIPADMSAIQYWLNNKHPGLWSGKIEHMPEGNGTIHLNPADELEAARRVAFALAKALDSMNNQAPRSIEHDSIRPEPSKTK